MAQLDERLRTSPIRNGLIARTHFADDAAALCLKGEIVPLEDLVLHDAGMDIRAPAHNLIRAHEILRIRRRIAATDPGWALSAASLEAPQASGGSPEPASLEDEDAEPVDPDEALDTPFAENDAFTDLFASLDATMAHADKNLAGEKRPAAPTKGERDPLVYDFD